MRKRSPWLLVTHGLENLRVSRECILHELNEAKLDTRNLSDLKFGRGLNHDVPQFSLGREDDLGWNVP